MRSWSTRVPCPSPDVTPRARCPALAFPAREDVPDHHGPPLAPPASRCSRAATAPGAVPHPDRPPLTPVWFSFSLRIPAHGPALRPWRSTDHTLRSQNETPAQGVGRRRGADEPG